ncbi:MAG: hypothetical protein ISS49_03280 [Anaerolineae bacterium]|nr:hypothetical protein [Anaerolineae bacterium]
MAEMITIPVELDVEQLVHAIQRLPVTQQREVSYALEDLFFGLLIAETENDEMFSREAAMAYVKRVEAIT